MVPKNDYCHPAGFIYIFGLLYGLIYGPYKVPLVEFETFLVIPTFIAINNDFMHVYNETNFEF